MYSCEHIICRLKSFVQHIFLKYNHDIKNLISDVFFFHISVLNIIEIVRNIYKLYKKKVKNH